ncbi:MAG: HEPN domain-containing protein [Rhodothermaceae bacterium]|nr:HEPN domain-containing protein [Rhodothermaceae bacterium]
MKDEARRWMMFADENLQSAKILLESNLFNPCLQNIQHCVEKP